MFIILQPSQRSRNEEQAAFSLIIKGIDHVCCGKIPVTDFLEGEMENETGQLINGQHELTQRKSLSVCYIM